MKKIRKRASQNGQRTLARREPGATVTAQGIVIKTATQIDGIRAAAQLTRAILDLVAERIGPGVSTAEIDGWVRRATADAGGICATLNYGAGKGRPPFPASCCTSINDVVCHGIPDVDAVLRAGDIVNVDVTSILHGYFGDASRMFCIGEVDERARRLVDVARECMELGIDAVRPGAELEAVALAIEAHAHAHGFSVVTDYGGHGVGLRFHEPPHVAHARPVSRKVVLEPGMVFTVEPMINVGKPGTALLLDGWTAVTEDGELSAQWEHTVLVTDDGVERLTG